jgi:hypothetical protein
MHARGARGYDNPVQVVFFHRLSYLILSWIGTCVAVALRKDYIGERTRILCEFFNVDYAGDVKTAVADENSDSRFLRHSAPS